MLGQLLAKVKITGGNVKHGKLSFPMCYRGECTYQTIMLKNTSSLPAIFKIQMNTHTHRESGMNKMIMIDVELDGGESGFRSVIVR